MSRGGTSSGAHEGLPERGGRGESKEREQDDALVNDQKHEDRDGCKVAHHGSLWRHPSPSMSLPIDARSDDP
jgi:hypothetical protein